MPSDLLVREPEPVTSARLGRGGGLLANELRTVFGRLRNRALLAVLAVVPILIAVAVRVTAGQNADGPPFLNQISTNGLFVVFTSLSFVVAAFLPLTVAIVAGDTIAGEAGSGTLRYLLVAPAGRLRLLAVKYAVVCVFMLAATFVVVVVGILAGLALFPVGRVALLSGSTVSFANGVGRAALVGLYVAASMAGLAAIGLFISTLTESPIGAMVATIGTSIFVQVLDGLPQVRFLHPYLFPDRWLAFGGLLDSPADLAPLGQGLLLQAAYVAVFTTLAWARFASKDVLG